MPRGAPTRECPDCSTRVHVKRKACECGYTFPAKSGASPTPQKEKKVDTPKPVDTPPVRVLESPPLDNVSQEYYRRVRSLEEQAKSLRDELASTRKLMREMLRVCKAFNDVPTSLAMFKQGDDWLGMDDNREVRPIDITDPEISFAQSPGVMAAPWDGDVFT